ncbi:MAG: NAD-dependent epimerase/dehydratase family protein, partial [Clostridia bacterium]|nr:NAD-dependent epimerase/dehydratase family protein [Clostridia bacterium]
MILSILSASFRTTASTRRFGSSTDETKPVSSRSFSIRRRADSIRRTCAFCSASKGDANEIVMKKWVVTGAAGFIGSNLTARLLALGKSVVGVDNFSTGTRKNIEDIMLSLSPEARARFSLLEGDVRDTGVCLAACEGASVVLHHAAQISVPLSVENPSETFSVNSEGFLNVLEAARVHGCRVVYASSSAVYGDLPELPKSETSPTAPLSPYGLSKLENEQRAALYWKLYGVPTVGLRYFNIYG